MRPTDIILEVSLVMSDKTEIFCDEFLSTHHCLIHNIDLGLRRLS